MNDMADGSKQISSKEMGPLTGSFFPVFVQNQFWTTIDLPTKQRYPTLEGKCAIITGSNTGLGFESAKQFLSLGLSHMVLAVRSLEKGRTASAILRAENHAATIEVWELDMESYDSIQAFVQKCQDSLPRIDFIIVNAGISPIQFSVVANTGHEKTIQVNHISTALLVILLLPVLKQKAKGQEPSRITIVNSVTAHLCKFPNRDQRPLLPSFDDTSITSWDPQERYGVSKLLSQFFMVKMSELVSPEQVIINMVDPGLTKGTGLARDVSGALRAVVQIFLAVAGRPVAQAASTYINATCGHGKESHGCFLMNCEVAPLAHWYYSHGKELSDVIWEETLDSLKSTNANSVIASLCFNYDDYINLEHSLPLV